MADAAPRIDPLLRIYARFAYEHGICSLRRLKGLLGVEAAALTQMARKWGWTERRTPPDATALAAYLAAFWAADAGDGRVVSADCDTRRLATRLRLFVAERLAACTAAEMISDPRVTTRSVIELTRCLKELMALEKKIETDAAAGRGDGDDATMATRTASDLAEVVALQVEQLHERCGEGGTLAALYAADAGLPGEPLATPGA